MERITYGVTYPGFDNIAVSGLWMLDKIKFLFPTAINITAVNANTVTFTDKKEYTAQLSRYNGCPVIWCYSNQKECFQFINDVPVIKRVHTESPFGDYLMVEHLNYTYKVLLFTSDRPIYGNYKKFWIIVIGGLVVLMDLDKIVLERTYDVNNIGFSCTHAINIRNLLKEYQEKSYNGNPLDTLACAALYPL